MGLAQVYCGTYHKYNSGSIAGEWVNLDGHDEESFEAACRKLHKDEEDAELMFQDFEGFPKAFYGESGLDERLWQWLKLSSSEQEIVTAYLEEVDSSGEIKEILESYCGEAKNAEEWVYQLLQYTGTIDHIPEELRIYFNWESYARDLEISGDYSFAKVEWNKTLVFNNY